MDNTYNTRRRGLLASAVIGTLVLAATPAVAATGTGGLSSIQATVYTLDIAKASPTGDALTGATFDLALDMDDSLPLHGTFALVTGSEIAGVETAAGLADLVASHTGDRTVTATADDTLALVVRGDLYTTSATITVIETAAPAGYASIDPVTLTFRAAFDDAATVPYVRTLEALEGGPVTIGGRTGEVVLGGTTHTATTICSGDDCSTAETTEPINGGTPNVVTIVDQPLPAALTTEPAPAPAPAPKPAPAPDPQPAPAPRPLASSTVREQPSLPRVAG